MLRSIAKSILAISIFYACTSPDQNPPGNQGNMGSSPDWLIPQGLVFDGGPGKDGIPALSNPAFVSLDQALYMSDDDLVIGFNNNGEYRAYPHGILDWHEIVNDDVLGIKIAVTYCPLTGSGIGWDRDFDGVETTFGVSGLLYNTNLIPYDRNTDSNWCQISLQCVNGTLKGQTASTFHIIETTWKTWKELFPDSKVISQNTGFSRNYAQYPYGDYKTNDSRLLFPVNSDDNRLSAKEKVLTVIEKGKAKVYRFSEFENGTSLIEDSFEGSDFLILGNKTKNYLIAFRPYLNNEKRSFSILVNQNTASIFEDDLGNHYDLLGNVVSGPDKDAKLRSSRSFMAYWFSVPAFYPNTEIFNEGN